MDGGLYQQVGFCMVLDEKNFLYEKTSKERSEVMIDHIGKVWTETFVSRKTDFTT